MTTIDFEVKCAMCGQLLENSDKLKQHGSTFYIEIEPCECCLEEALQKGIQVGRDDEEK